jgi:hypothetical protein
VSCENAVVVVIITVVIALGVPVTRTCTRTVLRVYSGSSSVSSGGGVERTEHLSGSAGSQHVYERLGNMIHEHDRGYGRCEHRSPSSSSRRGSTSRRRRRE